MPTWIALGSAVGGTPRLLVSGWIARAVGEMFPLGTMAVNVSGALATGVMATFADLGKFEDWAAAGWPHA